MSEVITDKLTGRATAGDVTITSEGGAVTMQLQQGVAKQWTNFSQFDHNARDSHNQSSLTDDGTGLSTISLTNSMNNDDYCVHNSKGSQSYRGFHSVRSIATGNYKIDSRNDGGNEADATLQLCSVHGDLA